MLVQSRRHDQKQPHTSPLLERLRALDVRCGGGLPSELRSRLCCAVVAIDPSEPLVKCAKTHSNNAGPAIDYRGGKLLEHVAQARI